MMAQILRLLSKRINSKLVASCVTSLLLAVTQAALAEYKQPPEQRSPSGYSQSTATRGMCDRSGEGPPLTVLAPHKHVGQTATVRPTFAWFVPNSRPLPMEFTLREYVPGSKPKLAQKMKVSLQSTPGIMKLTLPSDEPGLVMGKRYIWQVAISCDRNKPSKDLVANAEIEVVEMSPALKRQLSTTMDRLKMADFYASAGLWYDALREALGPAEDSRLREVASTLLEDLANLEQPERTQAKTTFSNNLRQIASTKRQQGSPRS